MKILNPQFVLFRTELSNAFDELSVLTVEIQNEDLSKTINELQQRLLEPFMFVIVGEVKAGKSSFINALLDTDKDICAVAPSPMTDSIQQIIFGEDERIELINPYLKKVYQPIDILREIAIVDTPGTNTIIEHHQEITERFIPGSDLIVFVFEAKNPYRQSAWDFFDYIHTDWHKKIIFILQQKDLMDDSDLRINTEGVRKHAIKKGISEPVVFAVSAKMEIEGDKDKSGYLELRDYISDQITGPNVAKLKLESSLESATSVLQRIDAGIKVRKEQYESDLHFREDVQKTLDENERISFNHADHLVEHLITQYDVIMDRHEDELNETLGFFSVLRRSISSIFNRKQSIKEWLDQFAVRLEESLNEGLRAKLNDRIVELAESIQQMGYIIDLKIRNSETILRDNHEIFSNIAEKRSHVLTELSDTFSRFLKSADNFTDEEMFPDKKSLAPTVATGSGIAVVGVIITALTNGAVFDITGGVLTAVGLIFAGVSLGWQRRKVMRKYREEVKKGRSQIENEITQQLQNYIGAIKKKISENFKDFDEHLENEGHELGKLQNQSTAIQDELSGIKSRVQSTDWRTEIDT